MDVLPRQKERRAVVPARKASSPGSVPPIFMPASGILQQQLKKVSLGVGEAVAVRAPPAKCRPSTPGRRGDTPRRPPGTRGAARCTTSLLEAHFAAALWAAPLDSFAYSAPLGYSQEASGTALEPP